MFCVPLESLVKGMKITLEMKHEYDTYMSNIEIGSTTTVSSYRPWGPQTRNQGMVINM